MNILVTGGAGFIGSHVVEQLCGRGETVTVLDNFNDFYPPPLKHRNLSAVTGRATIVIADICNVDKLREIFQQTRFDAIIHLAARTGIRPSLTQARLYTDVNITGTQNILELAREFGVKKFIFGSSSSVYGINQRVPFGEDDPLAHPISPYAATKLAGEALAHVYHHLYRLEIVCLRFFTVYGPRQRPDLAIHKFTRAIFAGQPIEFFGDGSTRRDYTHVSDIVQGSLAALDRPLGFEIINLGDARTVELRELVALLEKITGRRANLQHLPNQPGDVPVTFANIEKARRLLNYRPQVAIEPGLTGFVEWFVNQSPSQ